MNTYSCPKGHVSSEPDFCSECGAKIAVAPVQPAASTNKNCPDCGAFRHEGDVTFCEVCGYNFATGAHGEIPMPPVTEPAPVAAAPTVAEPRVPETPAAPPPTPAPTSWTLIVTVDPAPRDAGSPQPPEGVGPFTFALEKPVSLIGRRSTVRAIEPEISLDFDDAVSHRHAVVTRDANGALLLRDVGSSNGIEVNGTAVPQMTDQPLHEGDELTLGHWTRIVVKSA